MVHVEALHGGRLGERQTPLSGRAAGVHRGVAAVPGWTQAVTVSLGSFLA
jgi:hypothetical protein